MKRIAVLGAGLGGTIMAYELRDRLGREVEIHLLSKGSTYSFVPSNPWVAVGWRGREEIEVDLRPACAKRNITLHSQGATRVRPEVNRIEMADGTSLEYDYLVIATGPDLAFDEIEGFGRIITRNLSVTLTTPWQQGTPSRSSSPIPDPW